MSDRKSIFITGGGSGIGREVAIYFAKRGWFVGIADISDEGMQETLGMIEGGFKYAHKLDVRDRDAWDEALNAFSTAAGGRIDVSGARAGCSASVTISVNSASERSSLTKGYKTLTLRSTKGIASNSSTNSKTCSFPPAAVILVRYL